MQRIKKKIKNTKPGILYRMRKEEEECRKDNGSTVSRSYGIIRRPHPDGDSD